MDDGHLPFMQPLASNSLKSCDSLRVNVPLPYLEKAHDFPQRVERLSGHVDILREKAREGRLRGATKQQRMGQRSRVLARLKQQQL